MKVLVVGGGGREHALCWRISTSPVLTKLFCAPGNAGIAEVAECVPIEATDLAGLLAFARQNQIDLTVVGPEAPLVAGLVDLFQASGLKVFGPNRAGAELEGSKAFCRTLCRHHKIPAPQYWLFEESRQAIAFLSNRQAWPVVLKASGLAAGKGVVIAHEEEEARRLVVEIMENRCFGEAGRTLVIEEHLEGPEVSIQAITDGKTIMPLEPAQDHKRAGEGDQGPNTGGMGAVSPTAAANTRTRRQVESQVLIQAVHAMNQEERPYSGVLYAGIMVTPTGPRLLEFNCRFGDPETQPLVMRMRSDLLPYLAATAEGKLESLEAMEWDPRHAVCIVAAAPGYPGPYQKGLEIEGLEQVAQGPDLRVFHSGTARDHAGRLLSTGGRVLSVTALGESIAEARTRVRAALDRIQFPGMWYRKDIGERTRFFPA